MPHRLALYHMIETVMAVVVLIYAVRIALPIGSVSAYQNQTVKLMFSVLVAAPGGWLLWVKSSKWRARALLAVVGTNIYLASLGIAFDWTRFGAAGSAFGMAAIGVILYTKARSEERDAG